MLARIKAGQTVRLHSEYSSAHAADDVMGIMLATCGLREPALAARPNRPCRPHPRAVSSRSERRRHVPPFSRRAGLDGWVALGVWPSDRSDRFRFHQVGQPPTPRNL